MQPICYFCLCHVSFQHFTFLPYATKVQVLGGEDESEASDSDSSDNDAPSSSKQQGAQSTTLSVTKKRKISKNGFITSNSTKHHRTVDGRLEATKRAKVEIEQALSAKNGGARANAGGMFGSVFGFDSTVGGGDSSGKKLKSIGEVDRAMKSAHSKASKKA